MPDINVLVSYAVRESADLPGLDAIAGERAQIGINNLEPGLVSRIKEELRAREIEVNTLHLRRVAPEQAVRTLGNLRELFDVCSFTLHADKRTPESAYYAWIDELRELAREGITVGFENGRKTGSWLRNPYDLPKDPLFKLVLDTGHLKHPEEDLEVIEAKKTRILGIHLTAEPQGPYGGFQRVLPWMFKNPSKEYVLEYGRDNIDLMKKDCHAIRQLFNDFVAYEPTQQIDRAE